MNQMNFVKETTPSGTRIYLKGKLTSQTDFNTLSGLIEKEDHVCIDFEGVVLFDSTGIREWIDFLNKHPSKKFQYEKCPSWMIKQFSLVEGLVNKNAQVVSFYAPFITLDSNDEVEIFFKVDQIQSNRLIAPKSLVDGQKVEFSGVESKFLHFLELQKK